MFKLKTDNKRTNYDRLINLHFFFFRAGGGGRNKTRRQINGRRWSVHSGRAFIHVLRRSAKVKNTQFVIENVFANGGFVPNLRFRHSRQLFIKTR